MGCHRHKAQGVQLPDVPDPDRVLFERASKDLDKSRFTVARLTLQTLINTYPDSEFLPQAKFALANSFYKEGTSSSFTQAEAEFKDFITFFPTSDQADDAQYMIAMTHTKQIEQPDRDNTQAMYADIEWKRFMDNYPDSSRLPEAKERLRQVEEVLAEGDFRIGNEYYLKHSYPAAIDRYREVLQKYPDFSKTADAMFYLAESLHHGNQAAVTAGAVYYGELLVNHPLSLHAAEARTRLVEMSLPIPDPNPDALARAEKMKPEVEPGLLGKLWGLMKPHPDVADDTLPTGKLAAPGSSPNSNTNSGDTTPADTPATAPPIPGSSDPIIKPTVNSKPPVPNHE